MDIRMMVIEEQKKGRQKPTPPPKPSLKPKPKLVEGPFTNQHQPFSTGAIQETAKSFLPPTLPKCAPVGSPSNTIPRVPAPDFQTRVIGGGQDEFKISKQCAESNDPSAFQPCRIDEQSNVVKTVGNSTPIGFRIELPCPAPVHSQTLSDNNSQDNNSQTLSDNGSTDAKVVSVAVVDCTVASSDQFPRHKTDDNETEAFETADVVTILVDGEYAEEHPLNSESSSACVTCDCDNSVLPHQSSLIETSNSSSSSVLISSDVLCTIGPTIVDIPGQSSLTRIEPNPEISNVYENHCATTPLSLRKKKSQKVNADDEQTVKSIRAGLSLSSDSRAKVPTVTGPNFCSEQDVAVHNSASPVFRDSNSVVVRPIAAPRKVWKSHTAVVDEVVSTDATLPNSCSTSTPVPNLPSVHPVTLDSASPDLPGQNLVELITTSTEFPGQTPVDLVIVSSDLPVNVGTESPDLPHPIPLEVGTSSSELSSRKHNPNESSSSDLPCDKSVELGTASLVLPSQHHVTSSTSPAPTQRPVPVQRRSLCRDIPESAIRTPRPTRPSSSTPRCSAEDNYYSPVSGGDAPGTRIRPQSLEFPRLAKHVSCEENYYSPVELPLDVASFVDEPPDENYYSPVEQQPFTNLHDCVESHVDNCDDVFTSSQSSVVDAEVIHPQTQSPSSERRDDVPQRPPRRLKCRSKIIFAVDSVRAISMDSNDYANDSDSTYEIISATAQTESGTIEAATRSTTSTASAVSVEQKFEAEKNQVFSSGPLPEQIHDDDYICLWREKEDSVSGPHDHESAGIVALKMKTTILGGLNITARALSFVPPMPPPRASRSASVITSRPQTVAAPPLVPPRNRQMSLVSVPPAPAIIPRQHTADIDTVSNRPALPPPIGLDENSCQTPVTDQFGYLKCISASVQEANYSYVSYLEGSQNLPLTKASSGGVYEVVGGIDSKTSSITSSTYLEMSNDIDDALCLSPRFSAADSDTLSESYVRPADIKANSPYQNTTAAPQEPGTNDVYFNMTEQTQQLKNIQSQTMLDQVGLDDDDCYIVNEAIALPVTMGDSLLSLDNVTDSSAEQTESESEEDEKDETDRPAHCRSYYIAQEIILSEEKFVDVLKLLNEDFRNMVLHVTENVGRAIIPTSTLNQILHYLPQLQTFSEQLLSDLKQRFANWAEYPKFADVFVRKGPFLKLYSSYIKDFEQMITLYDDACCKYHIFADLVHDFEASDRCAKLALKHYMLKPIQRIPQYKLLLQDYLNHIEEDSIDYHDTLQALEIVTDVADHANTSMRDGDAFQKLLEIQNSLIGQFEVVKPGRILIKKGLLRKLSRKDCHPRMLFLFSDVLLYTVPLNNGYRLVHALSLAGMKVQKPSSSDFQTELSVISIQRSFTVSAGSTEERDEWVTVLTETIADNAVKRSTFEVAKTNPESVVERDFKLGEKAPVWVPDARVTMCMACTSEFTVTWRRHHCRACGRVLCGVCSDFSAPLQFLNYKAARVCKECYEQLAKEYGVADDGCSPTRLDSVDSEAGRKMKLRFKFRASPPRSRSLRHLSRVRPSVLKEVHANDAGSDMSGYLKVWKVKRWKKYWFVVKDKVLYKYRASEDMAAVESRPLLGYDVELFTNPFENVEAGLVFKIEHRGTGAVLFRLDSVAARDKWLAAIQSATTA